VNPGCTAAVIATAVFIALVGLVMWALGMPDPGSTVP
jgi:hypothetical protein